MTSGCSDNCQGLEQTFDRPIYTNDMSEFNLNDLKKKEIPKNARLQATISKDIIDRLDAVATAYGFDRSKLLEKAIESLLDKIEKK